MDKWEQCAASHVITDIACEDFRQLYANGLQFKQKQNGDEEYLSAKVTFQYCYVLYTSTKIFSVGLHVIVS